MANFNRVLLLGNLTRDPELKYLPSGKPVVKLGMAMNHRFRGSDGQFREEVTFVDAVGYGHMAETMNQYLRKGAPLMVEGRLCRRSWENDKGEKRSKIEVIVDRFQLLGGSKKVAVKPPALETSDADAGDDDIELNSPIADHQATCAEAATAQLPF